MLDRSTLSPLTTTADVAESIGSRLRNERLTALRQTVALPTTFRGFLFFVLGVLLVCAGVALQVFLSIQIRTTEVRLYETSAAIKLIEKRNSELVWAIAEATSLPNMRQRATDLGFVALEEITYLPRTAVAEVNDMTNQSTDLPAEVPAEAKPLSTQTSHEQTSTSGLVTTLRTRTIDAVRSWLAGD